MADQDEAVGRDDADDDRYEQDFEAYAASVDLDVEPDVPARAITLAPARSLADLSDGDFELLMNDPARFAAFEAEDDRLAALDSVIEAPAWATESDAAWQARINAFNRGETIGVIE